jgi:hypothetical protein
MVLDFHGKSAILTPPWVRYLEPLVTVALLLAALLACGNASKDPPAPPETATTLSAVDLSRDYRKGEMAGDAKWQGKVVRALGVASSGFHQCYDTMRNSLPCVQLDGLLDEVSGLPFVNCIVKDGDTKAPGVLKDARVTVKGRVGGASCAGDGDVIAVVIDECEVVANNGPAPRAQASPRSRSTRPVPVPRPPPGRR